MRTFGLILIILGVLGLGGGAYGLLQLASLDDEIRQNQATLREELPEIDEILDLDDIRDLVALDQEMSQGLGYGMPAEVRDAPGAILDAMVAKDDMEILMMGGLGGGIVVLVGGLVFFFIGGSKKKRAVV